MKGINEVHITFVGEPSKEALSNFAGWLVKLVDENREFSKNANKDDSDKDN